MPVLLSVAGAIAIVAAVMMLAAPLTNAGLRAGPAEALIQAIAPGVLALIGGCLLLGLGAVITRLARVQEVLEMHPMARGPAAVAPLAQVAAPEPEKPVATPPAVPGAPVSAAPPAAAAAIEVQPMPQAAPPVQAPAVATEPVASAAPPVQAGERMALPLDDKSWPGSDPIPEKKEPPPPIVAAPPPPPPVMPPVPPGPVRVLKSGVIEGMAYTLYSDGSVDADLPEGTMHFASIAEWRAHLRVSA